MAFPLPNLVLMINLIFDEVTELSKCPGKRIGFRTSLILTVIDYSHLTLSWISLTISEKRELLEPQ